MAYSTGTATGIADLLGQLRTFLTGQGFTCSATWTSSTWTVGSITKGGEYWIYQYATSGATEIILSTATGSSGTGGITSQAGVPSLQCYIPYLGGSFTAYHFFTDGTRVNVAIEKVAGVFSHFNFGTVSKIGTWTGGAYVTGMYADESTSTTRANIFATTSNTVPFGSGPNTGLPSPSVAAGRRGHLRTATATAGVAMLGGTPSSGTYAGYHHGYALEWKYRGEVLFNTPSVYNGRAVLAPLTIGLVQSNVDAVNINQVGYIPNVAAVNIADLNAGATVNTDWMVFPLSQKNGDAATYCNSANYGIAYQK